MSEVEKKRKGRHKPEAVAKVNVEQIMKSLVEFVKSGSELMM